ncbi:MAG TPA: hypothetical protein PLB97_10690, partial [Accumulibacter sp.]|nr:hypothetical protein [Accumulibacter sp.]
MLELRPNCELCDVDLPADSPEHGKSATERMIEFAATLKAGGARREENLDWRGTPDAPVTVERRLAHAMIHGITTFVVQDTEELWQTISARGGRPIEVIEG